MTIKFRTILQCAEGPLKGMLAQVTDVTNVDVELLCRDKGGTPHIFRVKEAELKAWRHTGGVAISGPKPQSLSEPGAAPELGGLSGQTTAPDASGSSEAAPVRHSESPPEPLNVEEFMEPLPSTVKILPMDPAPTWNMDDPIETPQQELKNKRQAANKRTASNPLPKIRYSALVTNGNGERTNVEYSLRKGVAPERFACIPIKLAKTAIADVAPIKVLNYTPMP